jgi:hypothetical protein
MARVAGMKEKLHMPLYDARFLDVNQQIPGSERVMRFFVDVQGKTRLETNMQAAGVLPSQNSFEARGMRVIVSSLIETKEPEEAQLDQQDESRFISDLIYNSVTTFLVGEKTMIEMPTYWFPAGAGVSPGGTPVPSINVQNHGEPNHLNSFRFAEPVFIEAQQNFRVEITFPQGVPDAVTHAVGPYRIWVVLDGYLTRDVQ